MNDHRQVSREDGGGHKGKQQTEDGDVFSHGTRILC
jgi:hypothetical protein